MPEGDTIHRSAARLKQVLPGAVVEAAHDNGRFVASQDLLQSTFRAVEARGKHLLMHLEDGRAIHSHMGMTGSWHVYGLEEPWKKQPRWAALTLQIRPQSGGASNVVCFSPKSLDLLTKTQLRRHPYLNRLGPDLMAAEFDAARILARFRVHNLAAVGEAVMNQTIVSGIGNVYKSETLFLIGTNPFQPVFELSDAKIIQIAKRAQSLMHKNRRGYPRKTRFSNDGQHLWVYGRAGQACLRCDGVIQMRRQGDLGRSTYWCPGCQAATSPRLAEIARDRMNST